MSEINQPNDILSPLSEKPKIPGSLNVVSILTFIGCGIGAIWTFAAFPFLSWSLKMMDKATSENASSLTEKQVADMDKSRQMIEVMLAHKWPIIITGIAGIALCLYGALQMRKLKKEGFYIYVVGEVLPVVAGVMMLGFAAQFNGVMSYVFTLGIPALFIGLYASNLKHMK